MATRRRTLLLLAGSTLAGLAGCAGNSDSDPSGGTPDGTPTATPDETPTPDENADGESEDSDSTAGGVSAGVDLSTASYLVGAAPTDEVLFQREGNTPRPLSEFPEAFADAVRKARNGGFETDEPSEELLAALDEITVPRTAHRWSEPVVRVEGTAYVVEPQLPVLEVRLGEEILEEADPDRTVSVEDEFEHEAVESLVEAIAWNGTPMTARNPYKRSLVPDEAEAFLDSYDYVEDHRGISPIVVERHSWEPPYTIELREFTEQDRWGREIVDLGTLDDDLRELLVSTVEARRGIVSPPYLTEEVPSSYFETLQPDSEDAERPLVRIGETVYSVRVADGDHEAMPVTVSTEPASPTEDGLARFRLTVAVTDDKPGVEVVRSEPVELHGTVGLPGALWIPHGGEYHLLDSDRYEMAVRSEDGSRSWSLAVEDLENGDGAVTEELSVGDELTATYTVPGTIPTGSYTLPASFAALWQEDPEDHSRTSGVYPFEIELALEAS